MRATAKQLTLSTCILTHLGERVSCDDILWQLSNRLYLVAPVRIGRVIAIEARFGLTLRGHAICIYRQEHTQSHYIMVLPGVLAGCRPASSGKTFLLGVRAAVDRVGRLMWQVQP